MPDKLRVVVQGLDRDLPEVTDFRINSNYLTSTDSFEFTIYPPTPQDRDFLRSLILSPVELFVGDASQVVGRIDSIDIGHDGTAMKFAGRDFIADLVECNVDPSVAFHDGMEVADAFILAMGPCGITSVVSDDDFPMRDIRAGKKLKAPTRGHGHHRKKLSEFKPVAGQGIYEFCNPIAARMGFTIQPGPDRKTLILSTPHYDQAPAYNIRRSDSADAAAGNNVSTATARRDYSSFPTYAYFTGIQTSVGKNAKGTWNDNDVRAMASKTFAQDIGTALDDHVFSGRFTPGKTSPGRDGDLYRLLTFRDDTAKTSEQLSRGLARAVAERLKETLQYSATIKGFRDQESLALFAVDAMANVQDSICGVNEKLWIYDRTFAYSRNEYQAEIKAWRPGSFVL